MHFANLVEATVANTGSHFSQFANIAITNIDLHFVHLVNIVHFENWVAANKQSYWNHLPNFDIYLANVAHLPNLVEAVESNVKENFAPFANLVEKKLN